MEYKFSLKIDNLSMPVLMQEIKINNDYIIDVGIMCSNACSVTHHLSQNYNGQSSDI